MQVEYEVVNRSLRSPNLVSGRNQLEPAGRGRSAALLYISVLSVDDPRMDSGGVLFGVESVRLRDEFVGFEVSHRRSPGQ